MADFSQYGQGSNHGNISCRDCEALFVDLADNAITPAQKAQMDAHLAGCADCTHSFAAMRQGQAWLDLLHTAEPAPEPGPGLVHRIIARTSMQDAPVSKAPVQTASTTKKSFQSIRRGFSFTGLWDQRLAWTAAMAFFSISLTMSMTGVRLTDLKPDNFRRTVTRQYFATNAKVVRYYENLRVVYEFESRVRELRRAAESGNGTQKPDQSKPHDSSHNGSSDGVAKHDRKEPIKTTPPPQQLEQQHVTYGEPVDAAMQILPGHRHELKEVRL
jgi:hypothetical protein